MALFETFWKRQKRLRGELPDVYVYDDIPNPLRVQIIHIMAEILGGHNEFNESYGTGENVRQSYRNIVTILRKELGVFQLPHRQNKYQEHLLDELIEFLLNEENIEYVLGAVELICRAISIFASSYQYRYVNNSEEISKAAIDEINARFREHGIGFEFDGEIIRIDTELIHAEAVKPALGLLRDAKFSGAEQEFLNAYSHYRKGSNKEALNDALKAFESTMKSIYDKRKWPYAKGDTASKLIKVAFDNGLIPTMWEGHFSALRSTLETGVPTARNKLSGHGQGEKRTEVPEHLVAYVLHMTASLIVFLVKSDSALP